MPNLNALHPIDHLDNEMTVAKTLHDNYYQSVAVDKTLPDDPYRSVANDRIEMLMQDAAESVVLEEMFVSNERLEYHFNDNSVLYIPLFGETETGVDYENCYQ
jgi:hypothetical protein